MADLDPRKMPFFARLLDDAGYLSEVWKNYFLSWAQQIVEGAVTQVFGTAGRITVTGTQTQPIVNIDPAYVASAAQGGTGQSSYLLGDTLYASGPAALSKLPGSTSAYPKILTQTGTGGLSAAPQWSSRGDLLQIFYVRDFGAVGDGVTDDTIALQAAFAAVDAVGGTLIIPQPPVAYLISGDVGIRNGFTPVSVVGFNSLIKRAPTLSGYNMFRYRSNMSISGIILEGYILSGTGDSDVVPQNGYGFRSGPFCDNVKFNNCLAYNCSFDGYYAEDENAGGSVTLESCSGYDNYRNDFACTQGVDIEIDGGIWADDSFVILKNASIDLEEDFASPLRMIRKAVVQNITCYHKVGFSGIMGVNREGEIDNAVFDGSIYGSACGLFFDNYDTFYVGYVNHINGAGPIYMNAVQFGGKRIVGRFVLKYRGQSQANNLMPLNSYLASEWTTYFNTGGATLTEGVVLGDRKGIRLENGSGGAHNYLKITLGVTPGEIYSYGCLIRAETGSEYNMGIWVVATGAALPHPYRNGPTDENLTQRICAAIVVPAGVTSMDLCIGSESGSPYDYIFADVYFAKGFFDNEAVPFPNFYMAPRWAGIHTFEKGALVRGAMAIPSGMRVDPDIIGDGGETQLSLSDVGTSGIQSITTEDGGVTYSVVASQIIGDPNITKGASDTILVAAAIAVLGAPTEGVANYAVYVAAGGARVGGGVLLDDDLRVAGKIEFGGNLVMLTNATILRDNDNGSMVISGGNGSASGANLIMLGGSHATAAGDWVFRANNQDRLYWDESNGTLTLSAGDFVFGTTARGVTYQAGPRDLAGSGDPEGLVTAATGSTYRRTNGTLYVKRSGSGNTGWVLTDTYVSRGSVTLVAGAGAVADTNVTANAIVRYWVYTPGGTQGFLSYANNAGVGFTITSTNAADTSVVQYEVVSY